MVCELDVVKLWLANVPAANDAIAFASLTLEEGSWQKKICWKWQFVFFFLFVTTEENAVVFPVQFQNGSISRPWTGVRESEQKAVAERSLSSKVVSESRKKQA